MSDIQQNSAVMSRIAVGVIVSQLRNIRLEDAHIRRRNVFTRYSSGPHCPRTSLDLVELSLG